MLFRSQGYRSLAEGEAVEFELEADHTGRKKAINVSGPGGAAVKVCLHSPRTLLNIQGGQSTNLQMICKMSEHSHCKGNWCRVGQKEVSRGRALI